MLEKCHKGTEPMSVRFKEDDITCFGGSNMEVDHEKWTVRMATVGRENCRRKSKEKERISMHKKKFSLLDHSGAAGNRLGGHIIEG